MSKYIKLEEAKASIREKYKSLEDRVEINSVLNSLPTIDIVHCGECKCCRDELIEEYMPLYIYCEKWKHETDFDSFCSAGERINNE